MLKRRELHRSTIPLEQRVFDAPSTPTQTMESLVSFFQRGFFDRLGQRHR